MGRPNRLADCESVENCCFAGLLGIPVCQLCARFSRNNCARLGQYHIRSTPLSASLIYGDDVVKSLSDPSLCFTTCVILRADNTSRLVEEYVPPPIFIPAPATKAGEIVAVRPSLGVENAEPSVAALKHSIAGTDKA